MCLAASMIYDICRRQGLCSGGIVTATPTDSPASLTQSGLRVTSLPAACASMVRVYNSCSMEMDFMTARARDVASCLWYVPPHPRIISFPGG